MTINRDSKQTPMPGVPRATERAPRATRLMANLMLVTLGLFVGLGAAELIARYYLWHWASPASFARFASFRERIWAETGMGEAYVSSHAFLLRAPTPNYAKPPNRHNALGYRGDDFPVAKPQGEFRIICMGGSTTYDEGVPDYRESYPAMLEKTLHEAGYANVRVINAGCPGFSSSEMLISYGLRESRLDADLVIIYEGINDWQRRMVWPPEEYRRAMTGDCAKLNLFKPDVLFPDLVEYSTFLRILMISMGRTSPYASIGRIEHLFLPVSNVDEWFSQVTDGTYPGGIFVKTPVEQMMRENTPAFFESNLENLGVIIQHQGAIPLYVSFAYSSEWATQKGGEALREGMTEMNGAMRAVASRIKAPFFDLGAQMPQKPEYWVDFVHNTPEGAAVKARLIAEEIAKTGLLDTHDGIGSAHE